MIGQQKLQQQFGAFTLNTLPHALLLSGETGSGRHTILRQTAKTLDLKIVELDIGKGTTAEVLSDLAHTAVPTLCIIDYDAIYITSVDKLLKFLEEASNALYVAVLTVAPQSVKDTIYNRCKSYKTDVYTKTELKSYKELPNMPDIFYDICTTPGQLETVDYTSFNKLVDLCKNISNNITKSTYANTLGISTKINYSEEYDKFDFNLFLKTLLHVSFVEYVSNKNNTAKIIYQCTADAINQTFNKKLAKEAFMLSFLADLWRKTR